MPPITFVLDNQQHRLEGAFKDLLAPSAGYPLDMATAYFALAGSRTTGCTKSVPSGSCKVPGPYRVPTWAFAGTPARYEAGIELRAGNELRPRFALCVPVSPSEDCPLGLRASLSRRICSAIGRGGAGVFCPNLPPCK
jgi:hypothetical protein